MLAHHIQGSKCDQLVYIPRYLHFLAYTGVDVSYLHHCLISTIITQRQERIHIASKS